MTGYPPAVDCAGPPRRYPSGPLITVRLSAFRAWE